MSKQYIGQCSICGGNVVQETISLIVGPPPLPYCESCGAVAARHRRIIPMEPRREYPPWRPHDPRDNGPIWHCVDNSLPRHQVMWNQYWC